MRSLSNKNQQEGWGEIEGALQQARPEPPPLPYERSRAILENALAETARRRARRQPAFFAPSLPIVRLGYRIAGSVAAAVVAGLFFLVRTEQPEIESPKRTESITGSVRRLAAARAEGSATAKRSHKAEAASPRDKAYRRARIAYHKKVRPTPLAVRIQRPQTFMYSGDGLDSREAEVTPDAVSAYQEAVTVLLRASDAPPSPQEDERLLVIVSNAEPERLSLTVDNAPATELGYAEASAVHQEADGSLVWERCTLQSGMANALFFQVKEPDPSVKERGKPASQDGENRRPATGAETESCISIPKTEEIENETRYRNVVPRWTDRHSNPARWADRLFGPLRAADVCSGGLRGGATQFSDAEGSGAAQRDVAGANAAGECPVE